MARAPRQLTFPFPPTLSPHAETERLRLSLEARLGEAVQVTVTDNRHSIVSVRTRPDGVHAVRVHHMFLRADPATLKQLARYVARRDRRSSRALSRFIGSHRHLLRERTSRAVRTRTRGVHFDLREIFDSLNERWFGRAVSARITWGPARGGRHRRSIKLGTYCIEDRLIRIHPILDQAWVPRFFLEWIVFHEMLHEQVGVSVDGDRRRFHPPEFRERERQFEHYERARRWERENLEALLRGKALSAVTE